MSPSDWKRLISRAINVVGGPPCSARLSMAQRCLGRHVEVVAGWFEDRLSYF
jgi:hypothetical protein